MFSTLIGMLITGVLHATQVKINKIFQCKIVNIILLISFNICFGCTKEPSH